MTDTARERVERGAKLLDKKRPGWWREIDLATLSLESNCNCVLGQLYGDYGRAELVDNPIDFGFNLSWHEDPAQGGAWGREWDRQWAELDDLWIEQIKARWEALA